MITSGSSSQGDDQEFSPESGISIIGAGAVGTLLAKALFQGGYRIGGVFSRTASSANKLAADVNASVSGINLKNVPSGSVIILCIPDDQIKSVASKLANQPYDWFETLIMHTSGVLSTSVLEPLKQKGALTLSFHPLVAITKKSTTAVLRDVFIVLEGDEPGVQRGARLAHSFGARTMSIDSDAKALYHAAAVLLSNGMVALMDAGGELLREAGLDQQEALTLLRPLLEATSGNLMEESPTSAITGPISRGDTKTIQLHLEEIRRLSPRIELLYRAISLRLLKIAQDGERLSSVSADHMEAIIAIN